MLRTTLLLVVVVAVASPLAGCKKLREKLSGKSVSGSVVDGGAQDGDSGTLSKNEAADAGAAESKRAATKESEGDDSVGENVLSGDEREPPPLPDMEGIRIADRFALKMPANWPRKRPELPPLPTREEVEAARARATGPQASDGAGSASTSADSKASKKKVRKPKRKRSRRRRSRSRRRRTTSKSTGSQRASAEGSASLKSASMQLEGRTLMTAKARPKAGAKAPPPRLVVEQDPWLTSDLDIEDYARAQRKSSLGVSAPKHVEVEVSKLGEMPSAILRQVVEFPMGESVARLVQQALLVFVDEGDDERHGYAFIFSYFESDAWWMDALVRAIFSSIELIDE